MSKYDRVSTALALLLASTLTGSMCLQGYAQEDNEKGWTTLFNGKDLDGWKFHLGNDDANNGTFTVKDGSADLQWEASGLHGHAEILRQLHASVRTRLQEAGRARERCGVSR